jgi:hypothetical protein
MGLSLAPPIDEGVNLLSKLVPNELADLRLKFPSIIDELEIGRVGGETLGTPELDYERAEVMASALVAVADKAAIELNSIQHRMRMARRRRLVAQVATLVCSSGVLAAFALSENQIAIWISLLTLLASVGTLLAEYSERLLRAGDGDIYQAFEEASNAEFKARNAASELRLLVKHRAATEELRPFIANSNKLAEELYQWVIKMGGSR